MAVSNSGGDLLSQIIRRDVAKAARGAALLYIVNTIIVILFDLAIFLIGTPFFLFWVRLTGFEWILDSFATVIAFYAVAAFLWARYKQGAGLGIHFYILGLLGLTVGALLFSWGGVQFLSAGYWLRQYHKSGVARSGIDGGDVVVYGNKSLVNQKSSRLVRIGYDIPRSWIKAGAVALVVGIVLYYSRYLVQASFGFISAASIGWILLIDGISLVGSLFAQRMYMQGYVRLPPSAGYDDRTQPS
jgi:hypothetical protein